MRGQHGGHRRRGIRGFGWWGEGGGKLADQWVQTDAMFEKFFDEADVVQAFQVSLERGRMSMFVNVRHTGKQAERGDRNGSGLGELSCDTKHESGRIISRFQSIPLGLQGGGNRRRMNQLEVVGFVVHDCDAAFPLKPFSIVGEGDVGPLGKEGTCKFQSERESPKQVADSHGLMV